jgi:glucoside 3-dehydrogenase (cytochrome c) hitch-hiker subunit
MSTDNQSIDRREAVRRVSVLLGGMAFIGTRPLAYLEEHDVHARAALLGESAQGVGQFTAADVAFLNEVAETIIPATSTPGAKAARVGPFMALMVTDTYYPDDQKVFAEGIRTLDSESQNTNGVAFMNATPKQRRTLLERLDREAKQYMDAMDVAQQSQNASADKQPAHYFRMMKELTLLGYFTSKIGCTQAQRYVESPGRFDPCVPYQKGEKAWAGHA